MSCEHVLRMLPGGDPASGLAPIGLSFPHAVIQGDPQERAHVYYDEERTQTTIGIWESDAGVVRFDPYPFDELCVVVEGEVQLSEDGGGSDVFRSGDVFLIKKSFRGIWSMPDKLKKYYVELK